MTKNKVYEVWHDYKSQKKPNFVKLRTGGKKRKEELVYELGLIYDVFVNEDLDVKILMTLTTPNCPVAESLPMEVEEKVKSLDEVKTAEVEITFDPPWTQDLMSEEAKLELGML